jgi:1L-myo-inositol 1-phosphate cytidylyltransferase / CDP-L-myo-inositol myo-inositolphosphotransferase
MADEVAFLETGPAAGHRMVVGGVTVLERRVRELAKAGVSKVIVAGDAVLFSRALPIPVEFVMPSTAAPDGARRERADVLAGVEVKDRASSRAAEWAVLRRMNKSFEGPIDALVNWRFSMRITRALARGPMTVTPNHVTLLAIAIGITAAALVLRGGYLFVALGGVLLELNSILDSVDGELARFRFQYSKLGQWLDNLSDDIVDNLFIAACGLHLGGAWAWIGVGAALGRVLNSLIIYVDVYRRTGTGDVFAFRYWFETDKATPDAVYDRASVLTYLRALGRRDTFVFAWMLACLAAFPQWVVGHGAAIAAVNLAIILVHLAITLVRR